MHMWILPGLFLIHLKRAKILPRSVMNVLDFLHKFDGIDFPKPCKDTCGITASECMSTKSGRAILWSGLFSKLRDFNQPFVVAPSYIKEQGNIWDLMSTVQQNEDNVAARALYSYILVVVFFIIHSVANYPGICFFLRWFQQSDLWLSLVSKFGEVNSSFPDENHFPALKLLGHVIFTPSILKDLY